MLHLKGGKTELKVWAQLLRRMKSITISSFKANASFMVFSHSLAYVSFPTLWSKQDEIIILI